MLLYPSRPLSLAKPSLQNCSKLQASTVSKDNLVYSLYSRGVKLGNDIIKAHNLKEPMVWGRNITFLNEMQAFRDKAHNKAKKNAEPVDIISDDDDSKEQSNASPATLQDVHMADTTSTKELPKFCNIPSRTLLPSDLLPAMTQPPSGKRSKLTSSLDYSLESPSAKYSREETHKAVLTTIVTIPAMAMNLSKLEVMDLDVIANLL
ncbi:hypothetical protein L218DRAFT_960989 [Marasmius fiardii PR-910]|nr:hypothetical protein L218DRAFT_960989 [Marasmius fiardii PR-910]